MFSMFFFLALYMQNILGYGALSAGLKFLPATLLIVIVSPLSGRLADRVGPRLPMAAGLSLLAAALFLLSELKVDSAFSALLIPFALMGAGMGLTMSPMSTAAMNAVDVTKAGVASGILSMSRMVGGSFGVAAIGALFQSLSTSKFESLTSASGLSAAKQAQLEDALGSGSAKQALKGLTTTRPLRSAAR